MTQHCVIKNLTIVLLSIAIGQATGQISKSAVAQESMLVASSQPTTEQADLLLYGGARTRSSIVQWYLEELGVPYDNISLDIQAGEHQQPSFLQINPMGKVPAIVDGDFNLWESGAILLYLSDKYGNVPESIEDRAVLNQWVIFANATLGPGLFLEDRREREMPRLLKPLNDILQNQEFIIGSELSVADVAVGSYLHYGKVLLSLDFNQYPAVEAYLARFSERPAFRKTLGQR